MRWRWLHANTSDQDPPAEVGLYFPAFRRQDLETPKWGVKIQPMGTVVERQFQHPRRCRVTHAGLGLARCTWRAGEGQVSKGGASPGECEAATHTLQRFTICVRKTRSPSMGSVPTSFLPGDDPLRCKTLYSDSKELNLVLQFHILGAS